MFLFVFCSGIVQELHGQEDDSKRDTLSAKKGSNQKVLHIREFIKANNQFSINLFRETVRSQNADNIFISPLSVSIALGITLNGALGETYEDIKEVLYLDEWDQPEINKAYATQFTVINSSGSEQLFFGNSMWIRRDLSVQQSFKEKGKNVFDAHISSIDFSNLEASERINDWVKDNTGGNIQNIVPDEIPRSTVMYLINTIYFQDRWKEEFDEDVTSPKDFYVQDSTITVDMMKQETDLYSYVSDEVKLLDLPYENGLKMTLIMPADKSKSIYSFIPERLSQENFKKWSDKSSSYLTILELPKFKIEYQPQMKKLLENLGMKKAFKRDKANFDKINSDRDLISQRCQA